MEQAAPPTATASTVRRRVHPQPGCTFLIATKVRKSSLTAPSACSVTSHLLLLPTAKPHIQSCPLEVITLPQPRNYPAVDTHLAGTSLGRRSDHSQHPIVVSPTPPRTNPTIMAPPSRLLGDKAHAGGRQPVLRYSPGLICKSVPHPHSRAPDHYRTLRKRPGSLKSPVCG